jgi:PAS domain S-box-containing protein
VAAKVLVVDDSSQERLSIGSMLGDCELITACDGVEALREIEKNPDLDLIVLDLNMPVMDGFQVLAELKSGKFPHHIPVIVLTNYDELDKEIRGLHLGAVDYIRKPVNMESLRARVQIHLEMKRMQHLIEDESLQCRQMLQAIFDRAPIGIGLYFGSKPFDPEANVPPLINPMYEKITGRSKEELMKLGWAQITHPEDLEKNLEFFEKMNSGEIPGYSMEKRYIRPDGSVVWADLTVSWLHFQGSSTYNYLSLVQDITARKNAEKALLESERSKSVLLSNLPGMAYRCRYDRDWTMEFVSAGCFSLTGYTDKDLLENRVLSFNSIIAPEYRDVLWEEWRRILAERSPFKYEYEIVTASGGRKWVLEMGQGVFNSLGEVVALEGIIIDITHQKQNETRLRYLSEHHPTTGLYNRNKSIDQKRKRRIFQQNFRFTIYISFCPRLLNLSVI